MKAIRLAGIGGILALAACAPAPEQAAGPHSSIWPCNTVHAELQRQEQANRQARKTRDSVVWVPVVGIAGFAIQPDIAREGHLRNRAAECKRRAGL